MVGGNRWLMMAEAVEGLCNSGRARDEIVAGLRAACRDARLMPLPMEGADCDMVARCAVACARMRVDPSPMLSHAETALAENARRMNGTHILSLVWSLAKVQRYNPQVCTAVRAAFCDPRWAKAHGWTMVPERVGAAAYAFATFRQARKHAHDPPLARALSAYYASHFEACSFSGKTLVLSAYRLAVLGAVDATLMDKLTFNLTTNAYFLNVTLGGYDKTGLHLPWALFVGARSVRQQKVVQRAMAALIPLTLKCFEAGVVRRPRFEWRLVAQTLEAYRKMGLTEPLLYAAAERELLRKCLVARLVPFVDPTQGADDAVVNHEHEAAINGYLDAIGTLQPTRDAADAARLDQLTSSLERALHPPRAARDHTSAVDPAGTGGPGEGIEAGGNHAFAHLYDHVHARRRGLEAAAGDAVVAAPADGAGSNAVDATAVNAAGLTPQLYFELLSTFANARMGSDVLHATLLRAFVVHGGRGLTTLSVRQRVRLLGICAAYGIPPTHPVIANAFAALSMGHGGEDVGPFLDAMRLRNRVKARYHAQHAARAADAAKADFPKLALRLSAAVRAALLDTTTDVYTTALIPFGDEYAAGDDNALAEDLWGVVEEVLVGSNDATAVPSPPLTVLAAVARVVDGGTDGDPPPALGHGCDTAACGTSTSTVMWSTGFQRVTADLVRAATSAVVAEDAGREPSGHDSPGASRVGGVPAKRHVSELTVAELARAMGACVVLSRVAWLPQDVRDAARRTGTAASEELTLSGMTGALGWADATTVVKAVAADAYPCCPHALEVVCSRMAGHDESCAPGDAAVLVKLLKGVLARAGTGPRQRAALEACVVRLQRVLNFHYI